MPETTPAADAPERTHEQALQDAILDMYGEIAENPDATFHFYHGRDAAERYGYPPDLLDRAPAAAVASFAGVGNPHVRSHLGPGEDVLDLGSGAGLDGIIAGWRVGPTGSVVGVDLNPAMCAKAKANASASGVRLRCEQGRMEALPVDDDSVDVVISNGVINLSQRKGEVIREIHRVLRPGGRVSIADMVSARPLKQSIVDDPNLWAS